MDARLIDITNKAHLENLLSGVESAENKTRKRDAWKLNECIEDNQRQHTIKMLQEIYPDSWHLFRIGDVNIPKKIVKKKSKAYKSSPKRKLATETETESYADVIEDSGLDHALKDFDHIFNAHKYAAVWINYINPPSNDPTIKGEYHVQGLSPYEYDIARHPLTGKPLIFILHFDGADISGGSDGIDQSIADSQKDSNAQIKKYTIWDGKNKVKVKRTITHHEDEIQTDVEIIEQVTNDLGRLPVAFLSSDSSSEYPLPSRLADKSIDFNVGFSDLKTASSAQGHGQLAISHPTGQEIQKATMGKHTAILLPQVKDYEKRGATKAEYLNANPDLTGQLEVLKFDVMNILDDEGIKAKGAIEGGADDFASGFDRLLSEADVQDIIEDNQSMYAKVEQEIYQIFKAYDAALNVKKLKSDKVSITFEKPKVLISDKETLENLEKRELLGLLLEHEKHMIMNPNLSEEEALALEEKIQAQRKEKLEAQKLSLDNSNDDDEEEDDAKLDEE